MVVYVDVLFAINFSMDFVSLFLCGIFLHKQIKKARIICASLIGGIYGTAIIFLDINPLLDSFLLIFVGVIICYVSFFDRKIKRLIACLIIYLLTSCILGGIMSALYSLLNRVLAKYIYEQSFENVYNGARFFIIMSITIMVATLFSKVLISKKDIIEVTLKIKYKGEEYSILGLSDSGNILTEPITGRCVILLSEKSSLSKIIDLTNEKNIRYIPYSDISKDGMLKGIIPDQIFINENSVDAVVAPINKEIFGEFEAIVPSALV